MRSPTEANSSHLLNFDASFILTRVFQVLMKNMLFLQFLILIEPEPKFVDFVYSWRSKIVEEMRDTVLSNNSGITVSYPTLPTL